MKRSRCILLFAAVIVLFACNAHSQTLLLGPCPSPRTQENFTASEFMGKWYEIERTFVMAEMGWQCIHTDYRENNGRIKVETVGRAVLRRTMTAFATFTPNNPARIVLRGDGSLPTQSTNLVLFTDYENVAVVWSCRNVEPPIPITGLDFLRNFTHTENLWILSRTRSLSADLKKRVYDYLDQNAISRRSLRPVNQESCEETSSTSSYLTS